MAEEKSPVRNFLRNKSCSEMEISMNITVYLGASEGNDPALRNAVTELGNWIGQNGNTLVYGGSKGGLMGAIADSVLNTGGKVIGVEPQFFIENEFQHDGLTNLIITKDMLKQLDAPCILYNLNGYYDSLKEFMNHMIEKGLSSAKRQKGIFFADNLEEIKHLLKIQ